MSITDCLGLFYPAMDEPIWLRTFDAKKIPESFRGQAQNIQITRRQLQNDAVLQQRLKTINQRQGIYFVVNAGGEKDADITRVNAVFCEMDDKPIIQQHDIFDNESPLYPSLRIETRKSVHAYWLLAEPITCDEFTKLQQGLIGFYKSDTSIKNLSRVMRVPFFNHVHYDAGYKYQRVTIHTNNDYRYSLAELQEAFPYISLAHAPQPQSYAPRSFQTLEDVKAECRARIMALDSWRAHGQWGSANGVCHNGEGNTGLRVNFASGSITCWSNCDLKTILAAFGLELPKGNSREFEYISRRENKSELYQWLKGRKQR